MKYTVDKTVDSQFVQEFLEKYMSLGFSNLPKKEIDILVFTLITKLGYIEGKDYYSIAKELMLDERKVKKLIVESSLRNEKNDTIKKSIDSLREEIFTTKEIIPEIDEKEKTITICIENPIVRRDFIYELRCVGYSFDENMNPERIKLPIYAFIAVFCRYDDSIYYNFKEMAEKNLDNASDKEKAFRDSLPLITKIKNMMELVELANIPLTSISSIATIIPH